MKARVSDIQRFSLYDGPGIRTNIFFMGCPLHCHWCQNPEAMTREYQIMYNASLCIGCGQCLKSCASGAVLLDDKKRIDRELCNQCGKCAQTCYAKALTISGKEYSLKQLEEKALKDLAVYRKTGGGLTASGGEPMMHSEVVCELFAKMQKKGVHTAIETTGFYSEELLMQIANVTDLFLYDIKAFTPEIHKRWTGVDNTGILNNFRKLKRNGKEVIARIPLIPGVNDGEEFLKILHFLQKEDPKQEVHILPFHKYGEGKYEALGKKYPCGEMSENTKGNIEWCKNAAEALGLKVNVGGMGFLGERNIEQRAKEESHFLYTY